MKEKVFILIAVSIFILFILIILTSLLSKKGQNPPLTLKPTINPTLSLNKITKVKDNALKNDKVVFFEKNILPKIKVLPKDEAQKINDLTKKLPLENEDFSALYLPLSNRVVFFTKNEKGRQKVDNFLKALNLDHFPNQYPHLITITDNWQIVEDYKKDEENMMVAKSEALKASLAQPLEFPISTSSHQLTLTPAALITPPLSPAPFNNPFVILAEIFKIFYENMPPEKIPCFDPSCSNLNLSPTASNQPFSPSPFPTIFNPPINFPSFSSPGYQSLQSLFKEAGEKVGVPPKILEGVAYIEYRQVFSLSPEDINLYSQPGAILPKCPINECSATGPMQITTGVDNKGSTSCSECPSIKKKPPPQQKCPNTWGNFAAKIPEHIDKNRRPNPCNLKDSIYAAAIILKDANRDSNSSSWTQKEVYKAGEKYHGKCDENYRYDILGDGNRWTYCEFLWWYYNNK